MSLSFENKLFKIAIPKSVATYVIAAQLIVVLLLSSGAHVSPATNSVVSGGISLRVARPVLPTESLNIRASTAIHEKFVMYLLIAQD